MMSEEKFALIVGITKEYDSYLTELLFKNKLPIMMK